VSSTRKDDPQESSNVNAKPWMKFFGKLRHLHEETQRINQRIEEAFEQIEPEDWE
jgi:hypothetical protein